MREAYVLINTSVNTERKVMGKLGLITGVTEVHIILGVYDLIVRVQANTLEELKRIILEEIRSLDNIRTTITMILI